MRRDFHPRRETNRGDAEPEKFTSEKQNHRTDKNAENRNGKVHVSVMSSGVETSLNISEQQRPDNSKRFLDFARNDKNRKALITFGTTQPGFSRSAFPAP